MADRGRIALQKNGFLMRVYDTWVSMKGEPRRGQIDLCHFMRVVLFWAWWRMFFQYDIAAGFTPFLVVVSIGLVVAFAITAYLWTSIVLFALVGVVTAAISGVITYFAVTAFIRWRKLDPERLDKFFYWAFIPIWGPVYLVLLGCLLLWDKAIRPAGDWFINKRVWYWESAAAWVTPVGFFLAVFFTGVAFFGIYEYVRAWINSTGMTALVTGLVIGAILLICAISVGIGLAMKKRPALADKEDEDTPKHETLSTIWAYVVSKKHRICPLIEVKP